MERGVLPQVPVTADVEALRAPIGAVDAVSRGRLLSEVIQRASGLDAADLRVISWMLSQLPSMALRASCEEATSRAWTGEDEKAEAPKLSLTDHARGELLGAMRAIGLAIGVDVPGRRKRVEVLADALARGSR